VESSYRRKGGRHLLLSQGGKGAILEGEEKRGDLPIRPGGFLLIRRVPRPETLTEKGKLCLSFFSKNPAFGGGGEKREIALTLQGGRGGGTGEGKVSWLKKEEDRIEGEGWCQEKRN